MRAIDQEQAGLVQAVRLARANGFTWARIGVALGVSQQIAQERFNEVDDELRSQDVTLAADEPVKSTTTEPMPRPAVAPEPVSTATLEPASDFSALNAMTTDEIIAMADRLLPKDSRLKVNDHYLRELREAIVVTLYKRDVIQPQIAAIISKSPQRVSQILADHYRRIERTWTAERAQWGKGG
jgi:hypothetical protein